MYQKAIVTFLDILGFGELVKEKEDIHISKILDEVKRSTVPNTEMATLYQPEVISFSDSIVRVRRVESEENLAYPIGLLFQELLNLVHAQGELIDTNVLIRGSVTFGDILISDGRVFGPALVEAYELESKFARFPRIIVDPQLIKEYKSNKLLKAEHHSLEQDSEYVSDLLKQGDDGMWFIDYARAIVSEIDEPEMYPKFLLRHREMILSGCEKHKKLNAVLSKYVWLANYHNQIISEMNNEYFERYELKKNDFMITSDEIPALQYIPNSKPFHSNGL